MSSIGCKIVVGFGMILSVIIPLLVMDILCNPMKYMKRVWCHKLTGKSQKFLRFLHICKDLAPMNKDLFALSCFIPGLEDRIYGETGYLMSELQNTKRMRLAINEISYELYDYGDGKDIEKYLDGKRSLLNASDKERSKICERIYKHSPYNLMQYREEAFKQYDVKFKQKKDKHEKKDEYEVKLY